VALFSILLWQALRGQSVSPHRTRRPSATLAAWAAITAAAAWLSVERRAPVQDVVVV
jgi:hypothetical protein